MPSMTQCWTSSSPRREESGPRSTAVRCGPRLYARVPARLEEAFRHVDDVARPEREVLLRAVADVLHRDADFELLALRLPCHLGAVGRGQLGEASGHRHGLDDGHALLVGERARLLHLDEDEDLLRVVLADG